MNRAQDSVPWFPKCNSKYFSYIFLPITKCKSFILMSKCICRYNYTSRHSTAICIVGIALEHVAVRAEHREHPALVIIGVLISCSIVCLWVVLVGAYHLGQVPISIVEAVGDAAILLDPPNFPIEQIVLHPDLDIAAVTRQIIRELRPGLETV